MTAARPTAMGKAGTRTRMDHVSNVQRAMWMVLITSLAAPLFASLIDVALTLAGPMFDAALPPRNGRTVGEIALGAYAWAALPATLGALALTPYVLQTGTYGWLHAAVAGVLAFAASIVIWPIGAGGALTPLAFIAGLVGIAVRWMLIWGRILLP